MGRANNLPYSYMTTVIALTSFDHGGSYKKGDKFDASEHFALQLEAKGLVRVIRPTKATGTKSSASPVAPASQKQTVKKSANGEKTAKAEK